MLLCLRPTLQSSIIHTTLIKYISFTMELVMNCKMMNLKDDSRDIL
jgi:hypothetical protein